MRNRRRIVGCIATLAAAAVLAGCGSGPAGRPVTGAGAAGGSGIEAPAPTAAPSTVATARVPSVVVRGGPSTQSPETYRLANPQPSGAKLVFLVEELRSGWARVQLPVRPNHTSGWVSTDDVDISEHRFRIEVDLTAHRLRAYDGSEVVLDTPAGVGRGETPTPVGRFYAKEIVRPSNPAGPYGPYAVGLSGYSDVLTDFAGGQGEIGIHGTNDPATLGTDVSHGCIRIGNDAVTFLAQNLPVGAPVEIRA